MGASMSASIDVVRYLPKVFEAGSLKELDFVRQVLFRVRLNPGGC